MDKEGQKSKRTKHQFKLTTVAGKKRKPAFAVDAAVQEIAKPEGDREMKIDINPDQVELSTLYNENRQFFDSLNNEDLQQRLIKSYKYSYGNFDHYYNPKDDDSSKSEVRDRLSVLPREWFEGKKVLDVGCNDGTFTLALTLDFNPNLIIGVDIDNKLISRAIKNIHKVTNDLLVKAVVDEVNENEGNEEAKVAQGNEEAEAQPESQEAKRQNILKSIESLPRSLRLSLSLPAIVKSMGNNEAFKNKVSKEAKDFLYERLSFRTENFISNVDSLFETYDVILCIKTIKWIHLNFGDLGVKALFHKAYESLEPNGLFIFDSLSWQSYKKRKSMNEDLKKTFASISFKPSEFDSYLKHQVGFQFKEALKFQGENSKDKRPLLVYIKPE